MLTTPGDGNVDRPVALDSIWARGEGHMVEDTIRKSGSHVVVLGNEKGGSGKSTTAMHLAIALLKSGQRVGTVDLDSRQRTLTHYLENRQDWIDKHGVPLEMPEHFSVDRSLQDSVSLNEEREFNAFAEAVRSLEGHVDAIIIDTPGTDSYLSRLGHSMADTLVTPLNDSFVDLDVLAELDSESLDYIRPSAYGEMVRDARLRREAADGGRIEWVVLRNRMSPLSARNQRNVGDSLDMISNIMDFRVTDGLGERVIFRELYLLGLTVFDRLTGDRMPTPSISHVTARQEVRRLAVALGLQVPSARAGFRVSDDEDEPMLAATAVG